MKTQTYTMSGGLGLLMAVAGAANALHATGQGVAMVETKVRGMRGEITITATNEAKAIIDKVLNDLRPLMK